MQEYNPNAVWTSKKKKVEYTPSGSPRVPGTAGGNYSISSPQQSSGSGKKAAIITGVVILVLAVACGAWFFLTRTRSRTRGRT